MRENILLLFCGGTISMRSEEDGVLDTTHDDDHKQMLRFAPRIEDLANIDIKFIINEDSSDMDKEVWEKVTDVIQAEYDNYDGFVITTGTDTMAYMSSALSFSLQGLGKPVAITGAQIPVEEIRTDARINLINVVLVSCMNLAGVFVVFGDKIILGPRAKKVSDIALNAFGTSNQEDFGTTTKVFTDIELLHPTKYKRHNGKPSFKNGFNDNIACIHNVPGLNNKYIEGLIDGGIEGIVFKTFGTGNLPEVLFPSLKKAYEKKIPVIIATQCNEGTTVMNKYSLGKKATDLGVIEAYDMSIEAASTKLMWMLDQCIPFADFKEVFQTNIVGELDKKIADCIMGHKDKTTGELLEDLIKVKGKKLNDIR
jgi:L-asparaginase